MNLCLAVDHGLATDHRIIAIVTDRSTTPVQSAQLEEARWFGPSPS